MKKLLMQLFGIDKLIAEQKETNELLHIIHIENKKNREANEAYNRAYHIK